MTKSGNSVAFAFVGAMAVAFAATVSAAATAPPAAGDYVREGGDGTLHVGPDAGKGAPFSLSSIGTNFHTCEFEGDIHGRRSRLDTDAETAACELRFEPTADGVRVSGTESCRYFCGARGTFDGLYLKPARGCDAATVTADREAFKQLYDRRQYAQALAKIAQLPTQCARTLHWTEEGDLRNDIAITQHKLGQDAECLRTLEPYAEDAAKTDEQVYEDRGHAPSEADGYQSIVSAARFNLRLCRGKRR